MPGFWAGGGGGIDFSRTWSLAWRSSWPSVGGGSHAHSTWPRPLSVEAWAERKGFPGQAPWVAGEDGWEPRWRGAGGREAQRTPAVRVGGSRPPEQCSGAPWLGPDGGGGRRLRVTRRLDRERAGVR